MLQTICPKQNKHYASQLPDERETATPAATEIEIESEFSIWRGRGQSGANGVVAPQPPENDSSDGIIRRRLRGKKTKNSEQTFAAQTATPKYA